MKATKAAILRTDPDIASMSYPSSATECMADSCKDKKEINGYLLVSALAYELDRVDAMTAM